MDITLFDRTCHMARSACQEVGYIWSHHRAPQLPILSCYQRVRDSRIRLHYLITDITFSGWASKNSNNVGARSVSTALYNSE